MNYHIIYSIIVHESFPSFLNLIENIYHYNQSQSIFIIVHCNFFMYKKIIKYIN